MIIELRGVEFHNKGAELMLYAILESIKGRLPATQFVMEKRPGPATSIKKQRRLGIYTKLNIKKYGIDSAKWGLLVPHVLRKALGFIHEKDIDAVIDGSGFAFGDFWGAKKAGDRLADHIAGWKRQGKKVILLPQAFGSFNDPLLQEKMKTIIRHADLIFARDRYSYDYLAAIDPTQNNIKLSPDFTNLINGIVPAYFDSNKLDLAIIPNNKLLESNLFKSRDEYLEVLNELTVLTEKAGKRSFFLIHEGEKDHQLAIDVNNRFKKSIPIVKEDNPLKVKGIIGACQGIVTSRFHGLVSALSQGIPCLCIGWSHKYKALMEDYNFPEGIIGKEHLSSEPLSEKISLITDADSAANCRERLKKASEKQKALAKGMWEDVFTVLNSQ